MSTDVITCQHIVINVDIFLFGRLAFWYKLCQPVVTYSNPNYRIESPGRIRVTENTVAIWENAWERKINEGDKRKIRRLSAGTMKSIVINDPDECRVAWQKYWPAIGLFDLWPVRYCFHRFYARPLFFLLAVNRGAVRGFLPLCWNSDAENYVQFPGDTWQGKTWLEQNRLIAKTPEALDTLLQSVPGPLHLRYLNWSERMGEIDDVHPDETGYLFHPPRHGFRMDQFLGVFPGKSRKKLLGDIENVKALKLSFRFNHLADLETLFQLNLNAFKENSYFFDERFLRSFEMLAAFLWDAKMLRITTILIGGEIAAVDMGAIFNRSYTLLTGGTSPQFPGIAKVLNMHHLEWSCRQRFDTVDFLCGDFNWKQRFRLTPRPLYVLNRQPAALPSYVPQQFHDHSFAFA